MRNRKKELVSALIWLRRSARALEEACEVFRFSARWHERLAKILEGGSPFNAHRAKRARASAEAARADGDRLLSGQHGKLGLALHDIALELDALTTLEERCELLNVNQADRGDLTDEDGIYRIAFVHGLEDSAMRRNEGRKSSPLFLVAHAAMMEWQLNTPEGRSWMASHPAPERLQ